MLGKDSCNETFHWYVRLSEIAFWPGVTAYAPYKMAYLKQKIRSCLGSQWV